MSNKFFPGFTRIVNAFFDSVSERGLYQSLKRLHLYNTIRPGYFVGEDRLGNKYYVDDENIMDLRERWVEIATVNNKYSLNATNIPAEWHAWLTHMVDCPPNHPDSKACTPHFQLEWRPVELSKMGQYANFQPMGYAHQGIDVKAVPYKTERYNKWVPTEEKRRTAN